MAGMEGQSEHGRGKPCHYYGQPEALPASYSIVVAPLAGAMRLPCLKRVSPFGSFGAVSSGREILTTQVEVSPLTGPTEQCSIAIS
jgi:hypothetical protein